MYLVVEEIEYSSVPNSFIVQASLKSKDYAEAWIDNKHEQETIEGKDKRKYKIFLPA
jgi:hypothetical protein|tara:strand:+ start:695 stop:865 length:171 start_codon:yes stop_codon:yes gene_type:complete